MWFILALLSAVFAALTSILAKIGIDGVNSNLATAIRTMVVVVMAWGMVFIINAQKGLNAKDITGQMVSLNKNYPVKAGCGFYPEDLTISDFHNILIKMLKNGKQNEVRSILNQRSIVVRDGKDLKAVDFVD